MKNLNVNNGINVFGFVKLVVLMLILSTSNVFSNVSTVAKIKNKNHQELVLNYNKNTDEHSFEYNGKSLEIYNWENAHWQKTNRKYGKSKANVFYTVNFYCIDENLNKVYVKIYKQNNKIVHYAVYNEDSTMFE